MASTDRITGIKIVGNAPWGTHMCQFYQNKGDLLDILVPYFKAGLENNEFCMWVTSEPLRIEDAQVALSKKVKNLDAYISNGRIEILDYTEWYTKSGKFDADAVLQGWIDKEEKALDRGFDGLRLTGNTFWLEKSEWENFYAYEETVDNVIGSHKMLAICTYSLKKCRSAEVIDVVANHEFALIRREGQWVLIQSPKKKQLLEKLASREEINRAIVETAGNAGEGIAIIQNNEDNVETTVFCNSRILTILGITREELIGKPIWTFLPEESREVLKDRYYNRQQGKVEPLTYETIVLKRGGERIPIEVSLSTTLFQGRMATVAFVKDITERKKTEEYLRTQAEVSKNMAEGACIVDLNDVKIQWTSPKFEEIFGYEPGEMIGKHASIINPPSELRPVEKANEIIEFIRRTGEWHGEVNNIKKDGTPFWCYASISTFNHSQYGEVLLAVHTDITERKRAEEAILFERERLTNILNTMTNAVAIINRDYTISYINPAMKTLFGDIDGRRCYEYLYDFEEVCPNCIDKNVIDNGRVMKKEWLFEETKKVYEVTEVPLGSFDDGTSKLTIFYDITERKFLEAMKDEFLSLVSHELRTPITVIKGSLTVARQGMTSPQETNELLQNAEQNTEMLSDILENMLEMTRHNIGKLILNVELIDIRVLANNIIKKLRGYGAMQKFNVVFADDLSQTLADPSRVERILFNLMENAVKYSPEDSEITLSSWVDKNFLVTSIIDRGPGISDKDQEILFNPFERMAKTSVLSGSGLGLVVCKRLVEAHDGWIKVESKVGQGSTFKFGLPLLSSL